MRGKLATRERVSAADEEVEAEMGVGLSAEGVMLKQLIDGICRANSRLHRAGNSFFKSAGLTIGRWRVLNAIADSPKTVAQIARHHDQCRQGFLWVVQSMVELGLVELQPNPNDRRANNVCCTPKGREALNMVAGRQNAWSNAMAENFSAGELKKLLELMDMLADEDHVNLPRGRQNTRKRRLLDA